MPPQPNGNSSLDEFLNPKSMLTPGVAGSLVMLITNAVCYNFTELPHRWVGLVLSGIIGFFVVSKGQIPFLQKMAFCIFNSLIIFSVGMGTANFVAQPTPPGSENTTSASVEPPNTHVNADFFGFFCSTANAQELPLRSTNSLTLFSGNDSAFESASNSHIKASNIGEIISATNSARGGVSQPITNSSPQIRIDEQELVKLKATNALLQSRIKVLETANPNSALGKPRNFFQQW